MGIGSNFETQQSLLTEKKDKIADEEHVYLCLLMTKRLGSPLSLIQRIFIGTGDFDQTVNVDFVESDWRNSIGTRVVMKRVSPIISDTSHLIVYKLSSRLNNGETYVFEMVLFVDSGSKSIGKQVELVCQNSQSANQTVIKTLNEGVNFISLSFETKVDTN